MAHRTGSFERGAGKLGALYICYLSLDDPLVHTQVVAYLEGLARRGHKIHLLTYELDRDRAKRRARRAALGERGIAWHALRYHKRPSLPATAYDVVCGIAFGALLVWRHRLDAVHARNHVPAAIGLALRRLTGRRLIFDVRGLMAEEYEDAGIWKRGSIPFRLTKRVERNALRAAAAVVVLTERVSRHLFGDTAPPSVTVIPCCTDIARLDQALGRRDKTRSELGLEGKAVMLYVGKFTGWYMQREMVDFFAVARQVIDDLHFLVLTQGEPGLIVAELRRHAIASSAYTVTRAEPDDVARHVAAADFGISLIRPAFSKISSSPTKVGEYLGAGLPIVASAGVGDVDGLVQEHEIGVLVDTFDAVAYRRAAQAIALLSAEPAARERCRLVAREHLSLEAVGVPRYDDVYRYAATCTH